MKLDHDREKLWIEKSDAHADPKRLSEIHSTPPELPEGLADWLGRVSLLHGVEFSALVPDARMLPEESIRFFTLDQNWRQSLIDGATSLGRITRSDHAHDMAITPSTFLKEADKAAKVTSDTITGLLLRSQLVRGWWPGVQFDGYDKDGNALSRVRLERLGPDIVICLFNGSVTRIAIHEPAEALHFGVDRADVSADDIETYHKVLRRTKMGETALKAAKPIDLVSQGHDLLRRDTNGVPTRTLRVADLASAIRETCDHGPFTAAEFALEMVEGVDRVEFVSTPQDPKGSLL